jgi:AcrR family transcriptional regulator
MRAAQDFVSVHGLAKVTMDDVAKAIGKGRSSIYYYYKSKDEIFDAVMRIEIDEMVSEMEKAIALAASVEDKLRGFFAAKLKASRGKGSFFTALETGMDADERSNFNQSKLVYHALMMKKEGALVTKILQDGVTAGELKTISKGQISTIVFILLSTLRGLKREMRIENDTRKIEPLAEQLTSMVMNGLYK